MTAINYLRSIEKQIAEKSDVIYISDDGRRIHRISEKNLNDILANNANIYTRQLNGETIINTPHTYYQIYTKVVSKRGRSRKNTPEREAEIKRIWESWKKELNI